MSLVDSWVAVIGVVAWPITVIAAAVILRDPLSGLLTGLRSVKLKSMKLAGVELAFAEATSQPKGGQTVVPELRRGPHVNESSVHQFLEESNSAAPLEDVIVDLGTGREWITTRLFCA